MIAKYLYKSILLIGAGLMWFLMFLASKSEYDENYGYFIYSMLISIILTLVIVIGWLWKRKVVRENKVLNIAFLLLASPASLLLFIEIYQRFWGQYFKL
jgi:hypothetical protein